MNKPANRYFATCPKGIETLLKQELEAIGSSAVRETVAGVYFEGDIATAYTACLWSRLANKILMPLEAKGSSENKNIVRDADDLYACAKRIAWEDHFPEQGSLVVDFSGTNTAIRNTQFGAQTVKDAIVDRIRDQTGERPDVNKTSPDIRINARLAKNVIHLSIDISGDGLHKRGYRVGQGGAPLKENLAAALLLRAGWPEIFKTGGALLDPMCGSGTFLLEAAMMACDMAPGLLRARFANENSESIYFAENDRFEPQVIGFGFQKWKQHDAALWAGIVADAEQRLSAALEKTLPEIRGYDVNHRVLGTTRRNIVVAGLDDIIRVTKKDVSEFKKPTHKSISTGLIICNPPYGERLGEIEALKLTYLTLAKQCKAEFAGWKLGVFTGNKELGRELRLRAKKKYQLFNGTIPSELLMFDLLAEGSVHREQDKFVYDTSSLVDQEPKQLRDIALSSGAEMVANRLRKNNKKISKWAKKNNITCYRVYDADMPEYSAAIDYYHLTNDRVQLHIQEYAAPKTVDEVKAKHRFEELVHACSVVFGLDDEDISTRVRRRNKGTQQYEKYQPQASNVGNVVEHAATLEVNFSDYLDTGLFLDHRPLRAIISDQVADKSFLNLFCYTATATVQAALGGAENSVSVDMSNTYLQWAKRNYELNNINLAAHKLVRDNCVDWLNSCRQGFDVIMLDPPSFSNSKRMEDVLDIQRDHVTLISRCMDLLNAGGTLYFSTNLRSFKLDQDALSQFDIENITQKTLDVDFQNNAKIHYCWQIK